jgi:hypothetical protein
MAVSGKDYLDQSLSSSLGTFFILSLKKNLSKNKRRFVIYILNLSLKILK